MLILDLKKILTYSKSLYRLDIKGYEVKYVTQNLLLQIANAYKWIDDDNL
jgi:hypothetical protein